MVTAGPTQEALDPVRFISNYSSGKMGYALAEEAVLRGANVTLISGPTKLRPHSDIIVEYVHSAEQMRQAVSQVWPDHQVLIMAAAVADYRPVKKKSQKLKKDDRAWLLRLEKTIDILKDLAQYKNGRVVIGFALETENEEQQAIKKLHDKNLDLICLNNPLEENAGFHHDTNKVTLIDRNEKREELPLLPKWQVAQKIIDRIEYLLKEK